MISPEEWDRIDYRPPSLDLTTALLIFSAVILVVWWVTS